MKIKKTDNDNGIKKARWTVPVKENQQWPTEFVATQTVNRVYVPKDDAPTDTRSCDGATFDEMFGERVMLWVSLVILYQHEGGRVFKSDVGKDGRTVPNWFIVGIETMYGAVGLPVHHSYWDLLENVPTLSIAPVNFKLNEGTVHRAILDTERYIVSNKGYLHGDEDWVIRDEALTDWA